MLGRLRSVVTAFAYLAIVAGTAVALRLGLALEHLR